MRVRNQRNQVKQRNRLQISKEIQARLEQSENQAKDHGKV